MTRTVLIEINGQSYSRTVEPRLLLSDFIRHEAGLTGTHVGCEHGICGACTVQVDGEPVRSCLLFAVQAVGSSIRTVEALSRPGEPLHPLQEALQEFHALQCGFCTAGILMSIEPALRSSEPLDEERIRELLSGNLCRCTGYQAIVEAIRIASERVLAGPT